MFITRKSVHYDNKVDLEKKSSEELQEMWRQNIILSKKQLVGGLADKGEKINKFRARIEEELNKRHTFYKDIMQFTADNGKNRLDTLESRDTYTGINIPCNTAQKNGQSNIDDENTLNTFVSQSGINTNEIIIKEKLGKQTFVRSNVIQREHIFKDKQQMYDPNEFPTNVERYAKNLCGRIDTNMTNETRHFFMNKPAVPKKRNICKSATALSLKESVTLLSLKENQSKLKDSDEEIREPYQMFHNPYYQESNELKMYKMKIGYKGSDKKLNRRLLDEV